MQKNVASTAGKFIFTDVNKYQPFLILGLSLCWGAFLSAQTISRTIEAEYPEGLDAPPALIERKLPFYPSEMARQGLYSGAARIVFMIDAEGQPYDFVVLIASDRRIGEALVEVMSQWRFEPPRVNGEPTTVRAIHLEAIATQRTGGQHSLTDYMDRWMERANPDAHQYRLTPPNELDSPPRPIERVVPEYPDALREVQKEGRAVIDIFISPEGSVLAPAVLEADDPLFGQFAYTAIRHWRFEPPTKGGVPVYTRARVPFRFTPDEGEE